MNKYHNTGKVKIGLCYIPPPVRTFSSDAEWLQSMLLNPKPKRKQVVINWLKGLVR